MSQHPLAPLFDPRGLVVIGASETPGKYGSILLRTLIEQGYRGAVHAVNPRGGSLLGRAFVTSLDDVPGPLDVALVVRPAPECPGIVRDLAGRGVPFVIVYAAGFAETGRAGEELQHALVEAARSGPTRLVGPNGMNVFSAPARLNLSGIVPFPEGGLGFLSASGNLGFAFAQEAVGAGGPGFSRFVSVGNQADLALHEYLDFLRADEATRVVLVYLEGFVSGRARDFLDVLSRTAARKPVLVVRGGRTATGQRTARSHTAALTPAPAVLRAALEQAGAVLVERADEALAMARAFLASPLPAGRRTLLVGEGGGHATLTTDAAAEAGLELPTLPDDLLAQVRPHLPAYAAILRNPVEMGGASEYDLRVYEKVLTPLFDWPGADQIFLFGGYALYDEPLAAFLAERRAATGKPVLLHDLYASESRPAFERLAAHGLSVFASAEVGVRAAAALWRGTVARERARRAAERGLGVAAASPPDRGPGTTAPLPTDLVASLQRGAASPPEHALTEDEAARFLAHFGVEVLPAALAGDAEEAVAAAERLGYPVVVKVHARAVVHKTDRAGVYLDLRRAEEVRAAHAEVARAAGSEASQVRLTPYRPGGIEVLIGARRDPELGPLLVAGVGGIGAEANPEVAIRVLPCAPEEVASMLAEGPLARVLAHARGTARPDPRPVAEALSSLARLILSVPEVAEAEVNPLRCAPDGCVALDARVLVHGPA
jgi:acetyltransferase